MGLSLFHQLTPPSKQRRMMTKVMDQFWIGLGVEKRELLAIKGRSALYAGLVMIAGTSVMLTAGIVLNLAGVAFA